MTNVISINRGAVVEFKRRDMSLEELLQAMMEDYFLSQQGLAIMAAEMSTMSTEFWITWAKTIEQHVRRPCTTL